MSGWMRFNRAHINYAEKIRIINSQGGKCAHCGHVFYPKIRYGKKVRFVNELTGEITDYYNLLDAEFHHIIPLSKGGTEHLSNVEACCSDCHAKLTKKLYYAKTRV